MVREEPQPWWLWFYECRNLLLSRPSLAACKAKGPRAAPSPHPSQEGWIEDSQSFLGFEIHSLFGV